jgi:predicted  nucleic acid-binding Zn-ribbon protein
MSVTTPAEIMDVLRKMQALDDEIRDIRVGRDALVGNMERLKKVLNHLDRELDDKRGKLAEAETWYRNKTNELEAEREKLNKGKSKLSGVTRSKEYIAVNKELDIARKNIAQKEEEVANLMKAIDEFRDAIAKEGAKVSDLRAQAEHTERDNAERLAVMEARIAEVDVRRAKVTANVDQAIVTRYARIAKAREGIAVVAVKDGGCSGCNMQLQPRFVENILRASSLSACPHCSRYLFPSTMIEADGAIVAL